MNDSLIAMAPSNTAYVDEDFYKNRFGEDILDTSTKAFPVNVVSLRIGWIIST